MYRNQCPGLGCAHATAPPEARALRTLRVIIVACVGGPWSGEQRSFRANPIAGEHLTMIEYTDDPRAGHYVIDFEAPRDGGAPTATWVPREH